MEQVRERPHDRNGFTLGILCALPVEANAVHLLFDETYDSFSKHYLKPVNDFNVYFNGRMGNTNVVLCKSPFAGKSATAGVVANLLTTYPKIRCILIVGICGALPSSGNAPARKMGDVIISKDLLVYDVQKQYDHGAQLKEGALRTHKFTEAALIESFEMTVIKKEMEAKLAKYLQQLRSDRVWLEGQTQPSVSAPNDSSTTMVLASDPYLPWRGSMPSNGPEAPNFHIGRMASADTVMKSGERRDQLAKDYGVIGFEMEGAGAWDIRTPCIIVKGISDWADSRKNDDWHFYAAATGAAGAKVVVEYLEPNEDFCENKYLYLPFPRNINFTGRRREIDQVEEWLLPPNGPTKAAIAGLGGVGKTQVALELAYRAHERNPDCPVIWLPCTSIETLEQSYVGAAKVLGFRSESQDEAKKYLKRKLNSDFTKWLLILDNVDDLAAWKAFLDVQPRSKYGRIMITTRNRQVAVEVASSHVVSVDTPDEQTAIDILSKSLIEKSLLDDRKAVTELLEKLANLPLAIVQAAYYLNRNPGITLTVYNKRLEREETGAVKLLSADFPDEGRYAHMPNPVLSTWLVSFKQIQELNDLADEYLSIIACVHYQDIPQCFVYPSADPTAQANALGLLSAFAFISIHPRTGYLSCHRLVHLAMRSWLKHERLFVGFVRQAANRLEEILPVSHEEDRPLRQACLPHAIALLNEEVLFREWHASFIYNVAHALHAERRYREALKYSREILEIRERQLGAKDPSTLDSRADLAVILQDIGQLEDAELEATKALQGGKEIRGEENSETIFVKFLLATIYKRQGRFAEAEELDQELMAVQEREQPNHPDTLSHMSVMASAYAMQGRTDEANAINARLHTLNQQMHGRHSYASLNSMISLAVNSRSQLEVKKIKELFEKLLKVDDPESEHPGIIASGIRIVRLHLLLQQLEQAEELGARMVKMATEAFGKRHPDTIQARFNLAATHARQGRLKEAEIMMYEVLKDQREVLPQAHIHISTTMYFLADVYKRQDRRLSSEMMREDAIKVKVREDVLEPSDPQLLENMYAFARDISERGAKQDAKNLMTRAVERSRTYLGADDPRTKTYASFLAELSKNEPDSTTMSESCESALPPSERKRFLSTLSLRSLKDKARRFSSMKR